MLRNLEFKNISVKTYTVGSFNFHTSKLSRKYFYDITKYYFLGEATFLL